MPELGEHGGGREPDIAGSDDEQLHGHSGRVGMTRMTLPGRQPV
jgi:hypothetical protein